jgi:DNA-directed RNA polymerase subunit RPC12/RpoP
VYSASQTDLLRCPQCLRRFLVGDASTRSNWSCPACEHELQLMVRSLPGPASQAASALGAQLLSR